MTMLLASGEGGKAGGLQPTSQEDLDRDKPVRVLIVEDEWLVALEIEAALLDAGYHVVGTAVSAGEAVEMAARFRPHLATMDIRLHGPRDGIDAALELYQTLGLRCLFVSAYHDGDLRERAEVARPLGWLQKPFMPSQLVLALQGALRILNGKH